MRASGMIRSRGTLADVFSGRDNSIGFIRLALSVGVVLSHSRPLGFGDNDLGYLLFNKQTNVGTMSVYGFFVLSGLLITRSARRVSLGRYLWHRALRILPGLWVCLLVTAFLVAPAVAWYERDTLDGFWGTYSGGPVDYVTANWWTGVRQWGISDLLANTTPWGEKGNGSVFDGALWSLAYEMLCYLGVAALAVTGLLKRGRWLVLGMTLALYAVLVKDYLDAPGRTGPQGSHEAYTLPLIGGLDSHFLIYLGFLFLVGTCFELYRDRVPVHDLLGWASAAVLAGTLLTGGFFVLGLPAYAYLLVWLSVRLPSALHKVGRKHDYSYGIYIYGFVGQQVLALVGANRWGYGPFALLSLAVATVLAFLSWHLVENPALRLKHWTPRLPGRRRTPPDTAAPEESPGSTPAGHRAPDRHTPALAGD